MAKVFSIEDGNLSSDIRLVKKRVYSDIDLSLEAKTLSGADGDIYKKVDAAAVKQSVKNLLLTNFYEKPYRPTFGGNLGRLLFELADEFSGEEIVSNIRDAIERYEPRAKILNLKVTTNLDYNTITIIMEFRVVETGQVESFRINVNQPSAPVVITASNAPDDTPEVEGAISLLLDENGNQLLAEQGLLIRLNTL